MSICQNGGESQIGSEIITCETEVQNFNSVVAPEKKKDTETLLDKPTFIQNTNSIGSIYARKRVETASYDPSHLHQMKETYKTTLN